MDEFSSVIPPIRAAEYLRMSTADQHHSIPHQQSIIREYATHHGMVVVRSYADEGKSGLTLNRREALAQLLTAVQDGSADFQVILVYDVSRWGRFQDVDESAYYEYLCRRSNVHVEYCAEPFVGQTGPLANILKSIKRAMAAEFSREHATKIAFAKRRAAMQGYFTGGPPGYALRRMVVGSDGENIQILERGAHKILRNYRTILVPGPKHEVEMVRRIYTLYVERHLDSAAIAQLLNKESSPGDDAKPWTDNRVLRVLRNERYSGSMVLFRTSSNLAAGRIEKGHVNNDPAKWVRAPIGFKGIVSVEMFERAKKIRHLYGRNYRDEQGMLDSLRKLLEKHGYLNMYLIAAAKDVPSVPAYLRHFGSLRRAYALIGYVQPNDWKGKPESQYRYMIAKGIIDRIAAEVRRAGGTTHWHGLKQQITINGSRTVAVVVGRCLLRKDGRRWEVQSSRAYFPDAMIVVRMDATNEQPHDYLCVPRALAPSFMNKLIRDDPALEIYRCLALERAIIWGLSH